VAQLLVVRRHRAHETIMITQKDKEELRMFLPIAVTITVVMVGMLLLAHYFGELHTLQGLAYGSFCGVILLSRQVVRLEREVRKLRQPDSKRTV